MKPMYAWAISVLSGEGGTIRMLTSPNNYPELFSTRQECREEIAAWIRESQAGEWQPRPVRVKIEVVK